jgi:hypothetical protein
MTTSLTAVKQELLARYVEAWLPAALHGHRRVCLVCATGSADLLAAVSGVLTELADLLEGRTLTVVAAQPVSVPAGVTITSTWTAKLGLPFAILDGSGDLLDSIVRVKGAEVVAFLPGPTEPGTPWRCVAELVASDGTQETLLFVASSEKALEKFKDELWALDEFAGVQLRDPADPELLDIALRPHPGPLRRMLAVRLAAEGAATVQSLREWTVRRTVFRAADTTRALQAMLTSGDVQRSPVTGRLTPATVITVPSSSPA